MSAGIFQKYRPWNSAALELASQLFVTACDVRLEGS
jgi:hypothetical protein